MEKKLALKNKLKPLVSLLVVFCTVSLFSVVSYAAETTTVVGSTNVADTTVAVSTNVADTTAATSTNAAKSSGAANETAAVNVDAAAASASESVAILTIFSDPTSSYIGISGHPIDVGTHSFITVKNISSSTITVGGLSGVAPNKMISVGTWGNKTEHTGVWYNLEEKFINEDNAYAGRVSLSYNMTQAELDNLNWYIKNDDVWMATRPCSTFAVEQWNYIVPSSLDVSPGFPSTPKSLANSIKTKSGWTSGAPVSYDYVVYYAQGSGAPIRSTQY